MPSSMQKFSRMQLFHLGQVIEQPILKNAKQRSQVQQTATISPGSGERATHSEECQVACTRSADCNYFTWVRWESNPFWGMPSSMHKLSRLQLFHLVQVREQPILKDSEQHAQAQQTATISPGSGKRATYSVECQAACTRSAECNYFTWVR